MNKADNDTVEQTKNVEVADPSSRLMTRGFTSLLGVSFFGAANDNILKQILVLMVAAGGLWANKLGAGSIGYVSLVLTLPFIFLSGYAGQLADKYSKAKIILWIKLAEIPIALIAFVGLVYGEFWVALFALFLLAVQSSMFGPAKFGIIPDVVEEKQLSKANGFLNAGTNLAVIIGSLAAGPLADAYYPTITQEQNVKVVAEDVGEEATDEPVLVPDPNRKPNRYPIGWALLAVAVVGVGVAALMPKMEAVNPDLKFSANLLGPHIQTFRDSSKPLLVVMFSWSGFYLVGQLALMLLADLKEPLGVDNTAITNLIGLLAISIVIGSCTVAFLSGSSIKPNYSLIGAIGMTVSFTIMGLAPLQYTLLAFLVFSIGIFAGFYIVPLQALLQYLSPPDERGRFFGTANALSFVFISGAGLVYIILAQIGVPAAKVPLACAIFAAIGTVVGFMQMQQIKKAQKLESEQA